MDLGIYGNIANNQTPSKGFFFSKQLPAQHSSCAATTAKRLKAKQLFRWVQWHIRKEELSGQTH